MQTTEMRIKCAEFFFTRETLLLEYRCLFCNEWFEEQNHDYAGHLRVCAADWMCSAFPPAEPSHFEDGIISDVKIGKYHLFGLFMS